MTTPPKILPSVSFAASAIARLPSPKPATSPLMLKPHSEPTAAMTSTTIKKRSTLDRNGMIMLDASGPNRLPTPSSRAEVEADTLKMPQPASTMPTLRQTRSASSFTPACGNAK